MGAHLIEPGAGEDKRYYARGREVFVRLSLLALMSVSCVLLLRPFLNVILCGIVIAIGVYPVHRTVTKGLGGRARLAAVLCSALFLAMVIVPSVLLAGTLLDGLQTITRQMQEGRLNIPPPPPTLRSYPVIGPRLDELWTLCSTNLADAVQRFAPQIEKGIPVLFSASTKIGSALLQFLAAIVVAGFMLGTSGASVRFADKIFLRIFGDHGPEFKELVASTIRTVANGILGVAVVQTLFASLGFWFVGLPGAGLWALIFLLGAVLQVGGLVLLPAVFYAFAIYSTGRAVLFLVWCIIVGLMDNVLKPILFGRGGKVPMIVVLLGVLGGFITMNSIIGIFVGAIVLSVGYKLFMAWLDNEVPNAEAG